MGFGIPLKEFFTDPQFSEYLMEVVLPGIQRRGILNHKKINEWVTGMANIGYHEMEALWIAITFEIWAKTYLDLNNENWNS
jgi:hypothetical protein